ncbi:MAG: hypothetical protein KAR11_03300 [Phycisphaerae bacterium]|nr:hypothetical protein [Phycisphaerae bacterium]
MQSPQLQEHLKVEMRLYCASEDKVVKDAEADIVSYVDASGRRQTPPQLAVRLQIKLNML